MKLMLIIILLVSVALIVLGEFRAYRRERRFRKLLEHKRRIMRGYLSSDDTE